MGLLLLTLKVLSLPFDPSDSAFLSWTLSYAAFHNPSNCWACRSLPSSSVEDFPCGFLRFKQRTFFNSVITSNNAKMDCCNYGHNITFNFDYVFTWFNDCFAVYMKVNGSRSGGFLPGIYQKWDEVIWLTPKKGCLLSNAPICWEKIEPSPEVSQQLSYNDWKQLGFLPQET